MNEDSYLVYHQYLMKRSRLGWLYRQYYLYPRIKYHLSGRVLDVGCGIGDFLQYYGDAVGLDINPYNVDFCRDQGLEAFLIERERYPVDDQSYDSAVLDNVVEHLDDPRSTLNEVHRVLRPGGKLLVGVPGQKGFAADSDHKIFYDLSLLENTLSEAGFRLVRHFYTPLRSTWLDRHASQYCLYGVFSRP